MALGLTRRGAEVFAPTNSNGTARRVVNEEVQTYTTELEASIDAALAGSIRMESWAALASVTGTKVGQAAEVPSDAGTHTDPVAGGTVNNAGIYRWSASPAGWRRVGNYFDPNGAPTSTILGRQTAGTGVIEYLTAVAVKVMLALNNVNNTSDANKPISIAQQAAFDIVSIRDLQGLLSEYASWGVVDQTTGKPLMTLDFDGRAWLLRSNEVPLLDDTYSHVIGGESGTVGLGFRHDGGVEIAGQTFNALMHADYKTVRTDYAGRVISATDYDDVDLIVTRYTAWVSGGNAYLWSAATKRISKLTNTGNIAHVSLAGGLLRLIIDDGTPTGLTIETPLIGSADTISADVSRLLHLPSSGQSNSVGAANATVLTPTPPRAGRALMYGIGPRVLGNDQNQQYFRPIPGYFLNDIVDAQEIRSGGNGETHMTSSLYQLTGVRPIQDAALGALYGIGSADYATVKKGTIAWNNLVLGCWRARLKAAMLGLDFQIPALCWDQGEGNAGGAAGVYLAALQELQTDITALVGQMNGLPASGQVPVVYSQLASFPNYSAGPNVPLDQLAAFLANPTKCVLIGPKYQYTYVDGAHMDANGQHLQGAMMGRAIGQLMAGSSPKPLYALSAVRTGAQVLVTYNVPSGSLTLDTVGVTDPGSYGFKWSDAGNGNTVTINSVAIASATTLLITLSAVPTGTDQAIRVALDAAAGTGTGRAVGARCCLRDTSPDTDRLGQKMYNWACHQRIAVTL
ncbi:hypothetical protein [Neorhizobium alkalisoli]|uniref:Sialate O-acetylesterase domain-containing protein n=1 Tax=Neorhizobium alkalisoli TaxID=528178 RepID=A0A561QSA1_9HYPH|nr:hypothetical protein [Neorhizobium alkalisoli]TWF53273.1 hypothetical protein FHW37_104550 [Neorhizobium alkalisoli]